MRKTTTGGNLGHTVGVCLIDTSRLNSVDFTQGSIVDQGLSLAVGRVIWFESVSKLYKARGLVLLTSASEGNEKLEVRPRSRLLDHCLGSSDVHRDRLLAHDVQA